MKTEKLSFEEVEIFYQFRGEFTDCLNTIYSGNCEGCCENGTVLFPGEDDFLWKKQRRNLIPKDIIIGKPTGEERFNIMKNCFALSCRLGNWKPLVCRLAPLIDANSLVGLISFEEAFGCPAYHQMPKKNHDQGKLIISKTKKFMVSDQEISEAVRSRVKNSC
jgi:hypothetical protein